MNTRSNGIQTKIVSILEETKEPLSAYAILGALKEFNPKIAPQTIYRALSSLVDDGKVHRLESKNAYIVCQYNHHSIASILSVCNDCGNVEENIEESVLKDLSKLTRQTGFSPKRHIIEIYGVCASCGSASTSI